MDYNISHDGLVIPPASNMPILVKVTLLNDGVAGEDVENITLILTNAFSPSENEVLLHDRVTISVLDNDSKYI